MPIRLTKTVKTLLIACFVAFLIQQTGDQFFGTHILSWFGLVPSGFIYGHRYWQLFTYPFLHGDVMYLFFNLIMLAFIGSELEVVWGGSRFLRYYFFCALCSGLSYLLIQTLVVKGHGMLMPMVGTSGAIYGLLTAYGLIFGERVLLFMMLFPMKAKHFVLVLALIELMTSIYSTVGAVASFSQLTGMAAGFIYLWVRASWILAKRRGDQSFFSLARQKKRKAHHLKLIVNNGGFDSPDDEPEDKPKTWH